MFKILEKYASAIVAGDARLIAGTFSTSIKVKAPGSNASHEGKEQISTMLSTAATVINDLRFVRTYMTNTAWSAILFEGTIDDISIQIIDHIHIDKNYLIDQVDIFMRPASYGPILLEKVTAETERRKKRT
ncbi:hypothetical protein [Mucilaginibacter aquaedulcis]|uniref:hypothetical protein n=1 Tax=Mucilaginibacter aquaedulcis TaxID=1187081 RepID=UPI0025B457BF|nr:hypothetical protein [Mucilaginibacter aquaedulcis]MDN3548852.1 hypothetical protein [Mucilaginibacter aquaedulcis]